MNEDTQDQNVEAQDAPGVPTSEPVSDVSQTSPISGATASEMSMGSSKKSFGPLFGIIIIVVLLLLAGFYFWGQYLGDQAPSTDMTVEEITEGVMPELNELQTQSSSDNIVDIEADLNVGDLDALDAELDSIDAELNF